MIDQIERDIVCAVPAKTLAALRENAHALLRQLLADRAAIEVRHAESGRRDPIKLVRGSGALDQAVRETWMMLQQIDRIETARRPARGLPLVESARIRMQAVRPASAAS